MKAFLRRLDAKGGIGFAILLAVLFAAVFAPWLSPHDPNAQDMLATVAPPAMAGGDAEHWLGTDRLGQDVLSRIIYGSRVSLITAFAAVAGSAVIGTLLGLLAGYFGGWVATVIMRLVDIVLAIPFILLALVFMTVFGPSILNVIIAFVAACSTPASSTAWCSSCASASSSRPASPRDFPPRTSCSGTC